MPPPSTPTESLDDCANEIPGAAAIATLPRPRKKSLRNMLIDLVSYLAADSGILPILTGLQ
jgi:hypothetical protein